MKDTVCAVVVTYNRLDLLKKCIDAVKKQMFSCDLFVVNNHSTDNTEEYLYENGISHICLETNTGGAGGFNIGIRKAVEMGYDCVWLMDDDCIPREDALEKLMNAGDRLNHEYGFLASRVLWIDGNEHSMNKINDAKHYSQDIYLTKQATFVSLLIRSDIIRKVGLPIKEFFIWGDDIEYTRRISIRNRIPCYYVKNSVVVHETKNNVGSKIAFDSIDHIERYKYSYRNEAYLYRQEGIKGKIYYCLRCAYNAYRIIFLSRDHKMKRLSVMLQGIKQGLSFYPKEEHL